MPPHAVLQSRDPLTAIRALAVRQALTFAGVPDTLALVPPPPFRGFFVLPATPEFPEQPGVLQLPLQSTQGKLHIIVMHRDSQHNLPSKTPDREVCPAYTCDPRSAFMVHSSDLHGTRGRHGSLLETVQRAGCHGRQRGVRARRPRRGQPPRAYHRRPPPPPRGPPPEGRRSSRGRASLTFKARPASSCPCNAAMAACAAWSSAISTKPKPRRRPVSRSVIRLTRSTTPYGANRSRTSCSVTVNARFPTKICTRCPF